MKDMQIRQGMRKLWTDHVVWTRLYIISAVAGTPDAQAAAGRLLKNQEDIGNAIVPYYGAAAGKGLTDLLKQHIMIAVDLVAAAKEGNNAKFAEFDKKWTMNADDLAAFLSGANPNWPKKDVQDLLYLHLKLTKEEAVARLTRDWAKDVATFDEILTEAMLIADTLAEGVVKQFPDKFKG